MNRIALVAVTIAAVVANIGLSTRGAAALGVIADPGGPYAGFVDSPIQFNASGSAGLEPLTYVWDFGDGSFGTGAIVEKAYAVAGLYTATLTVTDATGERQTAAVAVTVTLAPSPSVVPQLSPPGTCVGTEQGVVCNTTVSAVTPLCVLTSRGLVCLPDSQFAGSGFALVAGQLVPLSIAVSCDSPASPLYFFCSLP